MIQTPTNFNPDTMQTNFSSEFKTIIDTDLGVRMETEAIRQSILREAFRGTDAGAIDDVMYLLEKHS